MTKVVSRCAVLCAFAACLVLAIAEPWALSDNNQFLKGFVNHELLSFMGVLVTITLASAANLHVALTHFEDDAAQRGISHEFVRTKGAIRRSAFSLISLLALSFAIVVAKPIAIGTIGEIGQSFFNGAALLIVLVSVTILIDITQLAFSFPPRKSK